MKKIIYPVLILLILISLQNSLFEYFKILNIKPDIVLSFIICFTIISGNPWGTILGIAGGILEDVFFGMAFGINSIGCMLACFFIGYLEGYIYKDNIFIPSVFVFFATIIKEIIVFLFLFLTRTNLDIVFALTNIILPEAIYNSIIAAFIFRYVYKFYKELYINNI